MAETVANWGGWLVGVITLVFAYLRDRRKGDVDESTLILSKWKELVEQHQADIRMLKDEFAIYKQTAIAEIADLRTRLILAEKRITELETENAGLKRAIAQNSQSSAFLLNKSKANEASMQNQITRIDKKSGGGD
ncbi:MAG TPA: hypothetical protein VF638_00965 [Sphingomonas sp.]|jgi:spore germination protein YaaH